MPYQEKYLKKYLKYKYKYLNLRKQTGGVVYTNGVRDDNLLYKKYSYLNLSHSDIQSVINNTQSAELKKELDDFVGLYYSENPARELPTLVSMNPDIYAEAQVLPSESQELKIRIKKVHLLYQALKTGNLILFQLINHYWSKFRNPPCIIDIWETLPDNYKKSYNLLLESLDQGFIEIFKILCGQYKINKDSFYKSRSSFNLLYIQALVLLKKDVLQDPDEKRKLLNERLFYYLLPSAEATKYGVSQEMNELCMFVHKESHRMLGTTLESEYFKIPHEILFKIYSGEL
jgi:hypothetical protein